MQKALNQLDLTFPKQYLRKFEEYRRRHCIPKLKRKIAKKKLGSSRDNSNRCKQAIYLSNSVYCGVLREKIDGLICKCCPNHDPEPLEYSLFRRG